MDYQDIDFSNLSCESFISTSNWSRIHSGFRQELIDYYKELRGSVGINSLKKDRELLNKLSKIIAKYTGMSVIVDVEHVGYAMVPPDINRNNTLLQDTKRRLHNNDELKKKAGQLVGSVDLKNFRVSGDFSETTIRLFIDDRWIRATGVFTDANLADITLHEVGHGFYYFALIAHTYSIHLPILATLNQITSVDSPEKLELILKAHNQNNTALTKVDANELSKKSKRIIATALITNHINNADSIMSHRAYESVNFEYLADRFVIQNGGDVTFMESMSRIIPTQRAKASMAELALMDLWSILTIFFKTITAGLGLFIGSISLSSLMIKSIIRTVDQVTNSSNGHYDTVYNRLVRIRETYVEMLRDKDIDQAMGEHIRYNIQAMDEHLADFKNNKSLLGSVYDFIFFKRRKRYTQQELYRELEILSNNNLYLAAYDLRQKAK